MEQNELSEIVNESRLVSEVICCLYSRCKLHRVNAGSVRTKEGYRFSTGVPKGYSDLSGHRRGDGKAVYIECKMPGRKPTPEQIKFIEGARADGCIAGVVHSVAEAWELIGISE
jgi:hypothetical protein